MIDLVTKVLIFPEVDKPTGAAPQKRRYALSSQRKRNLVCSNKNYKLVVMKM